MAYGKYKDLTIRTQSDKVLRDKAFEIGSNPKYMDVREDQLQWFTSFLIKHLVEVVLNCQINNLQMNFSNQ